MFYAKNLPNWERAIRAAGGLGLAILGLALMAEKGLLASSLIAGSGLFVFLTGFVGFCPMCALVGRKLDKSNKAA